MLVEFDRSRPGARARRLARPLAAAGLALALAGCSSMGRDVDAYYRQMATNYQEAIDQAKQDQITLENRSRVLGTTGNQSRYLKAQRELKKLQSWEAYCARRKERFEKAAEWMESHFDIPNPAPTGGPGALDAPPGPSESATASALSSGAGPLDPRVAPAVGGQ